ncbi:MAG: HD domain-containing phosphohydrolase [Pyrinomonadaceae bacterium]
MNSIFGEKTAADDTLLRSAAAMDEFEGYPHGQANRVAWIADALGQAFCLASRDRAFLQQAALLHDIGELAMNREYISANRGLSASELLDMQRHPVIGEQEVAKLGLPRGVQLIVRWHHEWWNGSGYPDGLEGEQIPVPARILRVADTYSALTTERPFRTAISDEEARKYLTLWAAIEFDPAIVIAFRNVKMLSESQPTEPAAQPVFTF